MEEFPSDKAYELETDFDSLMPMMTREGDGGEALGTLGERNTGGGGAGGGGSDDDYDSDDSDDEVEQKQSQNVPKNAVMNNVSEVFGPNVDLLWTKKRKGGRHVKLGKTAGCVLPQEISDALR